MVSKGREKEEETSGQTTGEEEEKKKVENEKNRRKNNKKRKKSERNKQDQHFFDNFTLESSGRFFFQPGDLGVQLVEINNKKQKEKKKNNNFTSQERFFSQENKEKTTRTGAFIAKVERTEGEEFFDIKQGQETTGNRFELTERHGETHDMAVRSFSMASDAKSSAFSEVLTVLG